MKLHRRAGGSRPPRQQNDSNQLLRAQSQLIRCLCFFVGFASGSSRPPLAVAVLFLLCFVIPLQAQVPDIRADAVADAKSIALSGTVHVTLTLEGPAPLRVELPKQLLTADANGVWRIRPEGPAAPLKAVGKGREEWRQTYRLDPWVDGAPLRATFNPVTVNGQQVTWPAVSVTVTKTVGEATPNAARPVTSLEDVPVPDPLPPAGPVPVWVVVVFGLICAAVLGLAWARRHKPKPVPPHEWALAALAKLEGAGGAEMVEWVASILRTFVERRFAIPATKLTTAELSAAAEEQGWPVEQADPLRAILEECDRAKFAGDVPDHDGGRRLVRVAAEWVNQVSRPPEPR